MARTAGRKMPGIVKIAMLAFLLYAVVTIVSLRSQIAGKQAELESLSLRVQEYQEANAALQALWTRPESSRERNNGGKKTYMDLAVGSIVEGKVTGITKFGAFVALPEGKSGMVHISEVAASFVNDIKDFLQEGQQVKVKIINIDQAGRINLSIKKAQPQEPRQERAGGYAPRQQRFQQRSAGPRGRAPQAPKDPATMSFEDKLKAFMSDSESRQADVRHATDRKNGSRRRR